MYSISTVAKFGAAAAFCLILASCGGTYKPPEPAKLESIEPTVFLKQLWQKDLGGEVENNLSSLHPAYVGSTIYAATLSGTIMALERSSGEQLWSVDTGERLSAAVGASETTLAVVSESGDVIAYSAIDGSQMWRHPIGRAVIDPPLLYLGGVFVRPIEGELVAIDAATGERLWKAEFDQPRFTRRSTATMQGYGNSVAVGNASGQMLGFDVDVGLINWQINTGPRRLSDAERLENVNVKFEIVGNSLYAVALPDNLVAYDLRSNNELWATKLPLEAMLETSTLRVYAGGSKDELHAFDRIDGSKLWSLDKLIHRGIVDMAYVEDYLVVADGLGFIHIILPQTGELVGRLRVRNRVIFDGLDVQDDTLFVNLRSGSVLAYAIAAVN